MNSLRTRRAMRIARYAALALASMVWVWALPPERFAGAAQFLGDEQRQKLSLHPGVGRPGHFIVRLTSAEGDDLDPRRSTQLRAANLISAYGDSGTELRHVFHHSIQGFSVRGLPSERARWLAADPRVVYVEQDRPVRLFGGVAGVAGEDRTVSWGLDRLDQRHLPLDGKFLAGASGRGRGVHAFVIDTGIRADHEEFRRRIGKGLDLVRDGLRGPADCPSGEGNPRRSSELIAGHGTYVAGVLAGTRTGVANRATLHSVRALDCYGRGLASDLVGGVDWITGYVTRARDRTAVDYPALVNMSVGVFGRRGARGRPHSVLDEAIRASMAHNITYIVAAGNYGGEAVTCLDVSPARVWEAVTVGATTVYNGNDVVPRYSNRGPCVDIHAPGAEITSSWHRNRQDRRTLSGTSSATALVAGVVALILENDPQATPADVSLALFRRASYDRLLDEHQRCVENQPSRRPCAPRSWLYRYTPNRFLNTALNPDASAATPVLHVLRGQTLYRYFEGIRDWESPARVHDVPFLAAPGAPFGGLDWNGRPIVAKVDAAWHRWERHIEEISVLRGTVLYRFDFRAMAWRAPLNVAVLESPWASVNGPFERDQRPIDAAWHRYEDNGAINEIVMMRGTMLYHFDLTAQLRAVGELHEGRWLPPRDMARSSFMTLPGGPFANKKKTPLDSAYHLLSGDRTELVLIRDQTEYRYDYRRQAWQPPRNLGSLTRGAVWSKDRAPFYELDASSPLDAAWYQERRQLW